MIRSNAHTASGIGMFLSALCVVHCVAMPFVLMAFPFLGDSFLHHPALEWGLLMVLVGLGVMTMEHYRKKHHQRYLPGRIFLAGVAIFAASLVFSEQHHHYFTVAGSLVIAASHGFNLTMQKNED